MFAKGDRIVFDDPSDGLSAGTVTGLDEIWKELAYIKWDDGTPECGIPVDQLRREEA